MLRMFSLFKQKRSPVTNYRTGKTRGARVFPSRFKSHGCFESKEAKSN